MPGALRAQRAQVAERIARLQRLSAGLDRMIDAHENGLLLTAEQQAALFGPEWNPDWTAQAREQYGDTAQWRQFAERSASRTPEEWQSVAEAVAGLDRALAEAMDAGVAPGTRAASHLVERHREVFASYFPLTRQMQVCLARRYEADPGFAAHYGRPPPRPRHLVPPPRGRRRPRPRRRPRHGDLGVTHGGRATARHRRA